MTDTEKPFWERANRGIIGLGPPPWTSDTFRWPTEGYDGPLAAYTWDEEPTAVFRDSGRTREEWLALADEMIARWIAWRGHVLELPDDPAPP